MSDCRIISAKIGIIESICRYFPLSENDFSSIAVIFPDKRPSLFVNERLIELKSGAFIQPSYFTLNSFIEYVYRNCLHSESILIDSYTAASVLFEIYQNKPFPDSSNDYETFDKFFPFAQILLDDFEELFASTLPEKNIKEALKSFNDEKLGWVGSFFVNFSLELRNRKYVTQGSMMREVIKQIGDVSLGDFEKIIVAGVYGLTTAEKKLLKWFAQQDNVVLLFQEGEGVDEYVKKLGILFKSDERTEVNPQIKYFQSPDFHGQLLALNILFSTAITDIEIPDEKSVIVVPSAETLFPLLHQTLALIPNGEFNVSLGFPVRRSPLYGFLESLYKLIGNSRKEQFFVIDYIAFITHPYIKNILFSGSSEATRMLFQRIEEHFLENPYQEIFKLSDIENNNEIFQNIANRFDKELSYELSSLLKTHLVEIHRQFIKAFEGCQTISDYANSATKLIEYLREKVEIDESPYFIPFAERIIESLNQLADSIAGKYVIPTISGNVQFILNAIQDSHIPFPGTPLKGLQALGFYETRNLKFDKVYILDANDDVIPGGNRTFGLITESVRNRLELPSISNRNEMLKYYFTSLLKGSKEVNLFFVENEDKQKSRFIEELLWQVEKKDGLEEVRNKIFTIDYNVNLARRIPQMIQKTDTIMKVLDGFAYNASALNTYLKCQLQFYYAYILRLQEKGEVCAETDELGIGMLIHRILSKYFFGKKNRLLTISDCSTEEMERVVLNELNFAFGNNPSAAKRLLINQISIQLKSFLTDYQCEIIKNHSIEILDLESDIKTHWNSFNIRGRLDRIEKRGGQIFILDYKTGANEQYNEIKFDKLDSNDRSTYGETIGSLQLPFYSLLFSLKNNVPIESITSAFLYLGKSQMDDKIEVTLIKEDEDKIHCYQELKKATHTLLIEIKNVNIPFSPPDDFASECPNCAFKTICGVL